MKKLIILILGVFLMAASANAATLVTFETNYGKIQLELYPDKAPVTVKNFVSYVESGFYNGTIFHRVIPGFMIQGGGMTAEMVEKDTQDPITNEADNGLKNDKYTIAMARTPDPNSATAQFFINVVDNDFLNFRNKSTSGYGYAVFGKVITGMDTVDKIAKVQTKSERGHQDVPAKDVIITKATVAFSTDKEKK